MEEKVQSDQNDSKWDVLTFKSLQLYVFQKESLKVWQK